MARTKALWGKETSKAVENFPVSGERVPRSVIHWLARIKGAAARVTARYLYCAVCHFAFNPDFDPAAVDYTAYYNGQVESASYRSYVDGIATDLAAQ